MTVYSDHDGAGNETSTVPYFSPVDQQNEAIVEYTKELRPFINTVKFLLNHGTIAIVALGIVFNSLSFVVLTRKQMRKVTPNLYLAVLAICDTLALLLNFMVGVLRGQHIEINKSFQDSEHLCKLHSVIVELFNLLSVWIIVAFTAERYVMICFPLKARSIISRRNTIIVIACVNAFTLIFSLHKIFVSGFEGDSVFGYLACRTSRAILPGIIYFYVAFNTWFPTILIAVLNALIIKKVRDSQARRQEMTNTRSRTDEKVLKILLTVSSTYLALMLPLGIVQTIELSWNSGAKVPKGHENYIDFMKTKITLKWIRAFFFFFYQINFAINFFLYAFSTAGTKFRATLRRVFGVKGGAVSDTTVVSGIQDEKQPQEQAEAAKDGQESAKTSESQHPQNRPDKHVVFDETINESHN